MFSYGHVVLPRQRTFRPTNAQLASFVEHLRAGGWVIAPSQPLFDVESDVWMEALGTLRRLGPEGSSSRAIERELPAPVDAEWLASFRNSTSPDPFEDELQLTFPVHLQELLPDFEWMDGHGEIQRNNFEQAGIRPILATEREPPLHYEVVVQVSRDLVSPQAETLAPPDTRCACGSELAYRSAQPRRVAIYEPHVRAACPACGRSFEPDLQRVEILSHRSDLGWDVAPSVRRVAPLVSHAAILLDFDTDWPRELGRPPVLDGALVALCTRVFGEPFDDFGLFHG